MNQITSPQDPRLEKAAFCCTKMNRDHVMNCF